MGERLAQVLLEPWSHDLIRTLVQLLRRHGFRIGLDAVGQQVPELREGAKVALDLRLGSQHHRYPLVAEEALERCIDATQILDQPRLTYRLRIIAETVGLRHPAGMLRVRPRNRSRMPLGLIVDLALYLGDALRQLRTVDLGKPVPAAMPQARSARGDRHHMEPPVEGER